MTSLSSLARLGLLALFTSGLMIGCGDDTATPAPPRSSAQTGDEDRIVDVPTTSVKDQTIGNCWLYATVAWAESLHLNVSSKAVNLSESYLTYWDFFEKTLAASKGGTLANLQTADGIQTGGYPMSHHDGELSGIELMAKYGVIEEGVFIAEERTSQGSTRQDQALKAFNAWLAGLDASKPPTAREIRAALSKAFRLDAKTTKLLDKVFGQDEPTAIEQTAVKLPSGFFKPSAFSVSRRPQPRAKVETSTLAQVIPEWEDVVFPDNHDDRRKLLRRVQKVLHDQTPLPISWLISSSQLFSDPDQTSFRTFGPSDTIDGGHATLIIDYQAEHVPNYGQLPVGIVTSNQNMLTAALSSHADVSVLRVKNSWGTQTKSLSTSLKQSGFYDIYADYFNTTVTVGDQAYPMILAIGLPKTYDDSEPTNIVPDACASFASGGASVCYDDSSPGGRLVQCTDGVSQLSSSCQNGCAPKGQGQDVCGGNGVSADPCANAADGKYCGAVLGQTGNSLYECAKGKTKIQQQCSAGCQQVYTGSAQDKCRAATEANTPPVAWTCPAIYYREGESGYCDCNCGAADPDCALPGLPVEGCGQLQVCSADGLCVADTSTHVPPSWTCQPLQYDEASHGIGATCHCGCGAPDPDCASGTAPVQGCQAGETCDGAGLCQSLSGAGGAGGQGGAGGAGGEWGVGGAGGEWGGTSGSSGQSSAGGGSAGSGGSSGGAGATAPAGWTCDAAYYNEVARGVPGAACDCVCGVPDPDCATVGLQVYNCAEGLKCDAAGACIP